MKKSAVGILSAALLASVTLSAAPVDPADEKAVKATMEAYAQASVKKDVPALTRLYHDELMYSHTAGNTQTKAEVLKDLSGPGVIESLRFENPAIRVFGNVALFKTVTIAKRKQSRDATAVRETRNHIMWVLVEGPQGWQIAARHPTMLPVPGAANQD